MSIQLGSIDIILDERLWNSELMIIERSRHMWKKLHWSEGLKDRENMTVNHDCEVDGI